MDHYNSSTIDTLLAIAARSTDGKERCSLLGSVLGQWQEWDEGNDQPTPTQIASCIDMAFNVPPLNPQALFFDRCKGLSCMTVLEGLSLNPQAATPATLGKATALFAKATLPSMLNEPLFHETLLMNEIFNVMLEGICTLPPDEPKSLALLENIKAAQEKINLPMEYRGVSLLFELANSPNPQIVLTSLQILQIIIDKPAAEHRETLPILSECFFQRLKDRLPVLYATHQEAALVAKYIYRKSLCNSVTEMQRAQDAPVRPGTTWYAALVSEPGAK